MAADDDFMPLPQADPGVVAALGHGLKSGLTLGAAPKIEAGVSSGLSAIAESRPMQWLNKLVNPEAKAPEPVTYAEELKKNRAEAEAAQQAHPVVHMAGQVIGTSPVAAVTAPSAAAGVLPWIGQGAALGAAQAAGESKNVLGEESLLDPAKAAVDVGLGAAGGAAGGALGYGVGKGATTVVGKLADRKAMDAVGATTVGAREELKGLLKTIGVTEPGQFAQMVRESGVAGGVRGLGSVREAAAASKSGGIDAFKGLIKKATESGKTMKVNDLIEHLDKEAGDVLLGIGATPGALDLSQKAVADLATQGIANRTGKPFEVVAKAIREQPELLAEAQGDLTFTHEQLQEALKRLSKQSSTWRNKIARGTITEDELGRLRVYDALRSFQDKGLEEAVGASGRPARQAIALNSIIEKTAGHRETALEGQKKIGLQSALWGSAIGGTLSSLGLPHVGLPIMAAGMLEKATAPLRANVLTSVLSGGQAIPRAIASTGMLPMTLGRQLGTNAAIAAGRRGGEDDDFSPIQEPKLEVAKRGR